MKIQKKQEIEFFGTKTGNANSIALGYATETKNFGEVAVGVMNKSTAAKDPNSSKGVCVDPDATLFSVGCGGSGERKNALEVKGDGSVIIPGENGNINIADKIKLAFDTDASIELVKSAENSLQYTLMVNNESRGSINIPKDQFLKNVTYDSNGKQLVFTFVTIDEDEHVEKVPVGDLKDIYTAGEGITINGDNVISADFSSVMTAISDEKTLRETADNEIKSTLDTKADKTDVNNRLDNLQNYCVKFGDEGQVAAPFKNPIVKSYILQLNNNEEYVYADLSRRDLSPDRTQYIYDKTLNKSINVTQVSEVIEINNDGDFFRTSEPLDLTHIFYLDNEKTGIVENLTQLNIEASNVFVNLPYVEVDDTLDDDTAPQYIYDATDNKWIEVVETHYIDIYNGFNTEELLDLTHELYYSNYPNTLGNWMLGGSYSTTIGYNSKAEGVYSTAIGAETVASGTQSVAIGCNAVTNNNNCIAIGNEVKTSADATDSIVIGNNTQADAQECIAIGKSIVSGGSGFIALGTKLYPNTLSVIIGNNIKSLAGYWSTAIGYGIEVKGNDPVAIGSEAKAKFTSSIALGAYSSTGGDYAIALGKNVSNTKSIFGVGFDGVNGIDMDRDNYGLYLRGFGGYDGTNLVVKNRGTETLNPNIKSVQQIINEKADASAVPTKVSQLTNDSGYLTEHQSLDNYVKIGDDNTPTQLFKGQGIATVNAQQLILGSPSGGVNIQPNSINVNSSSFTFKANPTEGLGFIANTVSKGVILTPQGGVNSIGFDAKDANVEIGGSLVGQNTAGAVYNVNGNFVNLNPLYNFKTKFENSIVLNSALNNITAATTAEEVVTKFNALLADLKAKGFMEADE